MTVTISSLPNELLSAILEEAAHLTTQGNRFTYGIDSHSSQRILRGNAAPDALRWYATDGIRRVNSQWHDWASQYALRTLYIRRWRGSERYAPVSVPKPTGLPYNPYTRSYRRAADELLDGCSPGNWTPFTARRPKTSFTEIHTSCLERPATFSENIQPWQPTFVAYSSMDTTVRRLAS